VHELTTTCCVTDILNVIRAGEGTHAFTSLVNSGNNAGETPLMVAVQRARVEIIDLLLKQPLNPLTTDKDGETILHQAAALGHASILETLLNHGTHGETLRKNINAKDNAGWTPLHHAAVGNRQKVTEQLLAAGADASIATTGGSTAAEITALGTAAAPETAWIIRERDAEAAGKLKRITVKEAVEATYMPDVQLSARFRAEDAEDAAVEYTDELEI
jgi:hypothetical protein